MRINARALVVGWLVALLSLASLATAADLQPFPAPAAGEWSALFGPRGHFNTIVEAPLSDERSLAVIAEEKSLIPNRSRRVNTHHHWGHLGGLRTYCVGTRTMELDNVQDLAHAQGRWMAYLPRGTIPLGADMFTPPAPHAPAPNATLLTIISAACRTFYYNVQRLKLDIRLSGAFASMRRYP